jgi:hypothetical protein
MKSMHWILSAAIFLSFSLRPQLRADIVIDDSGSAVTSDRGSPVQAVTDTGTDVKENAGPAQAENKWLPWILGGAAAAAALIAGVLIADAGGSGSDEAEGAAAAAAKQAAAAEAAAAAAAATQAAQQAAAASNSITAAQAAAAQIAAGNTPPKTKIFISGKWESSSPITITCTSGPVSFTPSITFANNNQQAFPGGISDFTNSCTATPAPHGGSWSAIESTPNINITVDDAFYTGRATVFAPDRLILANGAVLRPAGGYAVLLQQE